MTTNRSAPLLMALGGLAAVLLACNLSGAPAPTDTGASATQAAAALNAPVLTEMAAAATAAMAQVAGPTHTAQAEAPAGPTAVPTALPLQDPQSWDSLGGTWSRPTEGLVSGESSGGDALYLYRQDYADFVLSAEVQALDREASLAFRTQDSGTGYLLILVPAGVAAPYESGLFLKKRAAGVETVVASTANGLPPVGEWANLAVEMRGQTIRAFLNGNLALELTDTSEPALASGRLGLRIFGDQALPCRANFRSIALP